MKLYVAYVDARAIEILPFDPAVHCREVDDGFTFDHTMVEGQVDEIQIERRQFGWSELTRVARSGVLVSWSPTGDPADAILLARGRLTIPEGLFTATQTVTCTCAPTYIRTKLLGFARGNLDRKPIADFRFSDANPDDPESYLLGTSGSYRVDPATWVVSLVDDLIGGRIVDLTDHVLGDPEDGPGSFGLPVSVLRAKLEVTWTQESRGICDLATYPGLNTGITSYDPDFGSRIEECLTDPNVEGWTIAGATWSRRLLSTAAATPVTSERYRYRAKGKTEVYERKADALLDPNTGRMRYTYSWVEKKKGETDAARWAREEKGLPAPDTDDEEEKDTLGSEHRLGVVFQAYAYDIQSIRAAFEFAQERREVMTASLEVPMIEGLVVTDDTESTSDDEDADVIEMSVDDVFADAAAPTYAPGHWDEGDYVMRGETRFRCTETHESTAFGMVKPGTSTTYWEPAADNSGDRASLVAVLDTALGQTYRDHVFMRLRKEARRRLRARNITITVPWEHGIGVTTADSVRISVPWDDDTDRPVVGKVVSVKRSWSGEAGPTVQIEIGVAFGAVQEAVDTDASESVWLQNGSVPVEIGIRANQLQSAFYSSAGMLIVNQAAAQRDMMNVIAMAGGDPAQAPVRHPTRLGFTLLPLEPQEEIVREMEWYGRLVVTPAGMDFEG